MPLKHLKALYARNPLKQTKKKTVIYLIFIVNYRNKSWTWASSSEERNRHTWRSFTQDPVIKDGNTILPAKQ